MFPTRSVIAVGVATAALGLALAPPAHAQQNLLDGLLALNPGMSRADLSRSVDVAAGASGESREVVMKKAIAEARESARRAGVAPMSGGGGTVNLGSATAVGDVFVSPSSTLFIEHGHTGIYRQTGSMVEAPGPGLKSRATTTANYKVGKGAVKQHVGVSQAKRNAAAGYAFDSLRGKDYNSNFAFNRDAYGSKMNCSQLVWAAYTIKAAIDIDSNGGFGVYPYNIKDSGWTTTYQTL